MGIFLNDHGLKEEVIKHGSHNQKTHAGSKGGGGGSGSASGSSNAKPSKSPNNANEMRQSLASLNRAKRAAGRDPDAKQKVKDVENLLRRAQKTGGQEALDNLARNKNKARRDVREGVQLGGVDGVDLEESIHEAIVSMGRALGGKASQFKSITEGDKEKFLSSDSIVQPFGVGS